ncbi:MAG: CRTAC1 family protein [Chloroflexota bacterium]
MAEATCGEAFVAHTLPHTTTGGGAPVRMFESNGSGLSIGDLDGDGLLDVVLANIGGPPSVLFNDGDFQFTRVELNAPPTRAASTVDVDGDGLLDVVFTTQLAAPIMWRNLGERQSAEREALPGVIEPAYSMAWGDLDADGDLDAVTGSYDAELELKLRDTFMLGEGAGIFYYENDGGQFTQQRLAESSQALVVYLHDVNNDSAPDIMVGNDFEPIDRYWLNTPDGWQQTEIADVMTHSTMSYTAADINNDGAAELYATDMKPYSEDDATMQAWAPVMDRMMSMPMLEGDPQVMENVMLITEAAGYTNIGSDMGLDATGWSWSSKFGDLDSDGLLDLYVVNGMIAEDLFGHLPDDELVEENQAFRNVDGTTFQPAPQWNLNATESGRGMSMGDMDNDGDLDIVVNNLLSASMLYENQLCGNSIQIDLSDSTSRNTYALGAQVTLTTEATTYTRTVQASSGYLSGDPARVHFGLPEGETPQTLLIQWPDGTTSQIDSPPADHILSISR